MEVKCRGSPKRKLCRISPQVGGSPPPAKGLPGSVRKMHHPGAAGTACAYLIAGSQVGASLSVAAGLISCGAVPRSGAATPSFGKLWFSKLSWPPGGPNKKAARLEAACFVAWCCSWAPHPVSLRSVSFLGPPNDQNKSPRLETACFVTLRSDGRAKMGYTEEETSPFELGLNCAFCSETAFPRMVKEQGTLAMLTNLQP